ncbi:winged helix family transcriptional regulator [Streptomyces himastatinicus ATCC 53653]|uniref:Winged helix family transcriptional regulator n=1 Tax=Streptomyces himastatinicus ATCC 53653 TaxID=457427 RepID=D9WA88_9ACTN|nr:BTAD domain-containing putative transcriptional regulator [Streptomyces himastatinicus]EFL24884.1 winged helix family transcriptional regulator [Streptomyces himastatinicus ATCC 53653]
MTIELTVLSTVSYRGQEITAPRLRGLLALLASDLRTGCSTGRLVDGLWPDGQPENPVKAVQILVSRLRSRLGAEVVVSTPSGYRLGLGEERVDASAVLLHAAACAEKARAGDHAGALAEAEEGLALWDGAGDGGGDADAVLGDPVAALRAERAAAHRALLRGRALGLARTGGREAAAGPLAELVREFPRDEELWLELVRCEAATAGTAAALATYERYRRRLRDELGTDPGPGLRALHEELLRGEAPVVRRGVPHEPNALLGRDGDIAAVAGLLRSSRVTSIVGPGGLGKTRLAAAVARAAEQRVVHLVPLAGVTRDEDVAGEVASAVGGAGGAPSAEVLGGLVAALGAGPVLLVLDNCEQVVGGVAEVVRGLVAATRELRVLTTSRTPLGIAAESVYLLPELDPSTTVELFGQRARAARPDVELPAEAVTALCRRLDGLPLAVELAAARVRVLSVAEIARRLEDRFALLRGGTRDAPQRHRTLHAVVDWSWNLLAPDGQAALRALSVFPGGFTADAAEHLVGPDELDVLEILEDLVGQSLLKVTDTPAGARFRMLETVREFSAAHRTAAGEDEQVTGRFLDWARYFGTTYHDAPFGPDAVAAWQRIRAEQDNLVRALRIGLDAHHMPTVMATAAALGTLWTTEAHYPRMITLAEDTGPLLSRYRPEPDGVEPVRTLATLVAVNAFLGGGTSAPRFLAVLRRLPPGAPGTLIGALATVFSRIPEVLGPDRTALERLCASDEPLVAGVAEGVAGYLWESENEPERAMAAARRMLAAFEGRRVPWLTVMGHSRLSELCLNAERGAEALIHMAEAMRIMDELGDWNDMMGLRWGMVLANLQTGDLDAAEHWLEQAVLHRPEEAVDLLTPDLGARAEIALARGETERGLALWRRATSTLEGDGDPLLEPWALEIQAVSVAAHAQHARLDLVSAPAAALTERIVALLDRGVALDIPICGVVLLALGYVDLATGRTGTGVRLIALAERFRCLRSFQPTTGVGPLGGTRAQEADQGRAVRRREVERTAALKPGDELPDSAVEFAEGSAPEGGAGGGAGTRGSQADR